MLGPDPVAGRVVTYSVVEAANILGVKEAWLLGQLRARRLPSHKFGRVRRLTVGDMEAVLEVTAVEAIPPMTNPHGVAPRSWTYHQRKRGS